MSDDAKGRPKHTGARKHKAPKATKIDRPRVVGEEEEEHDWHESPENGIRELRTQKGIRASDLAAKLGIPFRHLGRIETRVNPIPASILGPLCEHLGASGEKIAPFARQAFRKAAKATDQKQQNPFAGPLSDSLRELKIDTDPCSWGLKLWLRNKESYHFLPVDGVTKERLWAVLQKPPNDVGIITFNSGSYNIALNTHQLLCWQFLYEAPMIKTVINDERGDLAIWLADQPEPILFKVESDTETLVIDNDSEETNLQTFFEFLEIDPNLSKDEFDRVSFMDIDGERFFCHKSDISMIRVLLADVRPELNDWEMTECEDSDLEADNEPNRTAFEERPK